MSQKSKSRLSKALKEKLLIKFMRPFEEGSVNGYVLAIGPQFFMVALVDDRIRFNGFQCFRLSDVRHLQVPAKYAAFAEAALRKRNLRIPKKPRVDLKNLVELLLSANRWFPLVTIHRERIDADVCHIGRVARVKKIQVSLLEIDPNARWDDNPEVYNLKEITRVDFGGEYEEALHLIGGDPPATSATK